jgi:hypothetical protein
MPPTLWTSTDLLARFRRYFHTASTPDFPGDTDVYAFLSEGENDAKRRVLMCCPWLMLQAPTLMTTSDGGLTFTFGNDSDGNPIQPFGAYALYRQTTDVPDFSLSKGIDYIDEGNRIRMPNANAAAVQWPGGAPYYYGNVPTVQINGGGSAEPTLYPPDRRIATVWYACMMAAVATGQDIDRYEAMYETVIADWIAGAQLATQNAGALLSSRSTMPPRFRVWNSPYSYGYFGA